MTPFQPAYINTRKTACSRHSSAFQINPPTSDKLKQQQKIIFTYFLSLVSPHGKEKLMAQKNIKESGRQQ